MSIAAGNRGLIVHIVHRFDYGGLENGVVNVINGTARRGLRHAVVALTEVTEFRRRLTDGVAVYALRKKPGQDFGAYVRLYRLLKYLRPSVVHTRNFGTLDCALVAFLAGAPVRLHGEHGWDIFDPDGTKAKYRIARRVFGLLVHRFVTVSEDLRAWLVDTVGLPAERVTKICNGVDTERFRPLEHGEGTVVRSDAEVVIGSVTRFGDIKDPLNLVEAFIRLKSTGKYPAVRLVMVGDGALRPAAQARLREAGFADYASLPGSRDDIADVLRGFDVFVLGSLREGISNTILEAMASGVPVVATATGGNRELVVPGVTGALVPPGDPDALASAIAPYLDNAALRALHGRNARERAVSQYSIDAMIDNYYRLYEQWLSAEV